ncbi:MAG TPA: hypothetical protein VF590_03320 [Isosphaeraceae bacterium]|jgi:hypothetical protein
MKHRTTRLGLAAIALLLGAAHPARAALFTTWDSFTTTSATGTIAGPGGPVTVTYSVTGGTGDDTVRNIRSSSNFGTFSGLTVADVYEPNPPGTNDFLNAWAASGAALHTLTFSRPVVDPVFHVYNLDFRRYAFLGGLTPTFLSGLNLVTTGSTANDNDGGATADDGIFADPQKGNSTGSAYGSFRLTGTFTAIQWNRLINATAGGGPIDGNFLGVSVESVNAAVVPEPSTFASAAVAGMIGLGILGRRKRAAA